MLPHSIFEITLKQAGPGAIHDTRGDGHSTHSRLMARSGWRAEKMGSMLKPTATSVRPRGFLTPVMREVAGIVTMAYNLLSSAFVVSLHVCFLSLVERLSSGQQAVSRERILWDAVGRVCAGSLCCRRGRKGSRKASSQTVLSSGCGSGWRCTWPMLCVSSS